MIEDIKEARDFINGKLVETPVLSLKEDDIRKFLPKNSRVSIKLELFQQTGSFKARGVVLGVNLLSSEEKKRGIVTVTGGNHGIATAWGAKQYGVSAKIIMPKTADPYRINKCRSLGAEVILTENVDEAFTRLDQVEREEGRFILHPFNSENMVLGSATCCAEMLEQIPKLDILITPIGGGGLVAGMAHNLDHSNSTIELLGVEPMGADSFHKSLQEKKALKIEKVDTIADSLGSPMAMDFSFDIARRRVKRVEKVTDNEIRKAMVIMRDYLGLMVEPACATSLAGLMGPYREHCEGKKVGIIACGSNISFDRYNEILSKL